MSAADALAFQRGLVEEPAWDGIFNQSDPRSYFRVLYALDYILPDLARNLLRNLIVRLSRAHGRRIKVASLGCGYGALEALIRYPLDMDQLAHRFRDLDLSDLTSDRLIALDRHYFQSWPEQVDAEIIGLDVHPEALSYAQAVGLIETGICIDLESEDLDATARQALSGVDLIISTTALDFASEATFAKLYEAAAPAWPWLALFALRMHPLDPVRALAASHGMILETLDGISFVQRRFASTQEWTDVLMALEAQGIATRNKEAEGLLHANFHLLRPGSGDLGHESIGELVSVSKGNDRRFGNWRRRPWGV